MAQRNKPSAVQIDALVERVLSNPATVVIHPPSESSVEISTSAKGMAQLSVKVYNLSPDVALDKALQLYTVGMKRLQALIPEQG